MCNTCFDCLDFALVLWMKLPVVERINPQSNKFATSVENKGTSDSKLNDSPVDYMLTVIMFHPL